MLRRGSSKYHASLNQVARLTISSASNVQSDDESAGSVQETKYQISPEKASPVADAPA